MKENRQKIYKKRTFVFIFYGICLTVFSLILAESCLAINAKEVAKHVQNRYRKTKDIQANLEMIFYWKVTHVSDTVTGKIYLKQKNYFKLEKKNQVIVTDGINVWTYSPLNNQTLIDRYRPTEDTFLPQKFIFSFSKEYRPEIAGEEKVNEKNCYVLILRPIKEHDIVKRARVWVDKKTWVTHRIEYVDVNDNLTTYNFFDIQFDKKLSPSEFKFQSPPGTEIIDMR